MSEFAPGLNYLFLQEELSSTSVEHIIVNPNAAYDKFKDKRVGTKGLGETGLKIGWEGILSSGLSDLLWERVPSGDVLWKPSLSPEAMTALGLDQAFKSIFFS